MPMDISIYVSMLMHHKKSPSLELTKQIYWYVIVQCHLRC